MRFSANTGFLWTDLPFLDRLKAAREAGFDAVEFHDEAQRAARGALLGAVREAGLAVLGLNVAMGESLGCAAIPGEGPRFRAEMAEAEAVADALGAGAIHVLAGRTDAPEARACYVGNLRHALAVSPRTILIEPISRAAVPGYALRDLDQARAILAEIDHPRLRILFDCYHVAQEHGDVAARFHESAAQVGHVQIAAVPGRDEPRHGPGEGAPDYARLLPTMAAQGYAGAFGCEYRPSVDPARWLAAFRAALAQAGG